MSRGPGKLQADIIELVRQEGTPTTLEGLRWTLHIRSKVGSIPKSWAFAFERAVRSLASPKRSLLIVEKRRLASLSEWVTHYPGKTLDCEVRRLRLDLLPVLAQWLEASDGPGPRFSALENERFAFSGSKTGSFGAYVAATNRETEFGAEWSSIEQQIWPHLRGAESDDLFHLVAKGRQLFARAPLEVRLSLRDLVATCGNKKLLPEAALEQLRSLTHRVLPKTKTDFLALKSRIYQCIQPVRIRQPEMKREALIALLEAKPDYMKGVHGFNPPGPRKSGMVFPEDHRWRGAVAKGSPLSRLVDHSAFQEFHFLRLK